MVTCTLGDSVQLQPRWSTLCFENYEYISSGKGLPIILPGLTSIGLKRAQDSLLLVSHRARMSPSEVCLEFPHTIKVPPFGATQKSV